MKSKDLVILWMDKIQESSLLCPRPGVGVGTISQWEGSAELSLCSSVSLSLLVAPGILDLPSARKRQSPGRGLGERTVVGP